jgi:hypothetical protein
MTTQLRLASSNERLCRVAAQIGRHPREKNESRNETENYTGKWFMTLWMMQFYSFCAAILSSLILAGCCRFTNSIPGIFRALKKSFVDQYFFPGPQKSLFLERPKKAKKLYKNWSPRTTLQLARTNQRDAAQQVGEPDVFGEPVLMAKTASSGEGVRQPCTSRKPTRCSKLSYSDSVRSLPSVQTSMLSDCI